MAELRTSGLFVALQSSGAKLEATQMLLLVGDEMNKGELGQLVFVCFRSYSDENKTG